MTFGCIHLEKDAVQGKKSVHRVLAGNLDHPKVKYRKEWVDSYLMQKSLAANESTEYGGGGTIFKPIR